MPKISRILKKVSVEIAGGTRRCHRQRDHQIRTGQPCLVIIDETWGTKRNYCPECAKLILKQCCDELRAFRDVLYPNGRRQQHAAAGNPLGQAILEANAKRRQRKRCSRMTITEYNELLEKQTAQRPHANSKVSSTKCVSTSSKQAG